MVDEWPVSIPKSPISWISIKIGLWVEKWIRTKQRPSRQEMTLGHEWYDANQWVESNPAHYPPFLRTSNKVQMCRSSTIWWAVHENEAPICWWAADCHWWEFFVFTTRTVRKMRGLVNNFATSIKSGTWLSGLCTPEKEGRELWGWWSMGHTRHPRWQV